MALSIGVTTNSKIDVGGHKVLVKSVIRPNLIILTVDGGPEITVSENERVQILPEVFVFAGIGGNGVGSRLAFEAPKSIEIHRKGTGAKTNPAGAART